MSDLELVALNLTAEYMSINSELQLFRYISGTDLEGRIERSVYNRRKRKLFPYIEKIRETLSSKFSDFTDVFIVDSTPIEICKISRANRSAICSTDEIKPAYGYCAAQKSRYFGYKLHAVCDKNGIFHSFDFSPANVHDVNYLHDIKENFENCLLIGDRGYISKELQLDLFNYSKINLSVPMRKNQHNFVEFSKRKSKIRKRIETNISQLCGQFLININLAKTFQGLATKNPIMNKFRQEDFLSKLCKDTFGGYASTQIQKARGLNKKIVNPVEKERKGILDFCVILEDSNSIPAKDWLKDKNFLLKIVVW